MITVDTNVLVRIVTDDGDEAPRARTFVAANDVHVGVTVILETAWVLKRSYGLGRAQVATAIRALIGLPRVSTERRREVVRALEWAEAGMDFADALHLSLVEELQSFATFDLMLQRQARRHGRSVVVP